MSKYIVQLARRTVAEFVILAKSAIATWGYIEGNIAEQSDLQSALSAKENTLPTGNALQYLRGDKEVHTLNTSVVPEGARLYYTQERFDTALSEKTTDDLAEGDSLYFTVARARAALSAAGPLFYNPTTGEISLPAASALADGYLSAADWATFNGKQNALGYTPENVSQKGQANGYVPLGSDGKIPSTFLPAVSLGERYGATSEAEMLALNAQHGDSCVRSDLDGVVYILLGSDPSILDNWQPLNAPYPVTSVNGQTGNINLNTDNINEDLGATNQYFTQERARASISATGPIQYNPTTGVMSALVASAVQSGVLSSTDWNTFNNKESAITPGTTSQYFRGDKTWQTLNTNAVAEGSNLYFTTARVRNALNDLVELTDASTIAVDATLANNFRVTLGGNRTLGNPTGAFDGQRLLFRIRQDGTGGRILSLGDKFRLGVDIPAIVLSTGANKTDYLGVIYSAVDDKFDAIAFSRSY